MFFRSSIIALSMMILGGCAAPLRNDGQVEKIVAAYERQEIERLGRKGVPETEAPLVLSVIQGADDVQRVDAEFLDAPRARVVARLAEEGGISYQLDGVHLHGRFSGRFSALPLRDALERVLAPIGLTVAWDAGGASIRTRDWGDATGLREIVYEMELNHIDSAPALTMLEGVFGEAGKNDQISYGPMHESNAIYLKGREDQVCLASQLLAQADREQRHVVIEALVVDFSMGDLRALGGSLLGLEHGRYSDVNINFGNIGNYITFTRNPEGVSLNLRFSAVLNAMISDNKARLISRPYVTTLSGKPAKIEITGERYIVTQNAYGSTTTEVPAGVRLDITPTVLPNGKVRMSLYVEDSKFSTATVEGVLMETSKNSAQSVIQVDDGQTLVIGGLAINRNSMARSGFPGLRNVPGMDALFARQSNDFIQKEVVIMLTPHIWEPGLVPPLPAPDAMRIDQSPSLL